MCIGNKDHPNILISFINSILKRDNPITSVELISTEHDSIVEHCDSIVKQMNDDFVGEHGIRLDLVGKTSTGEILNIVLRKQMDSLIEESKMQNRNDDALCKQGDSLSEESNMYVQEVTILLDKVIFSIIK